MTVRRMQAVDAAGVTLDDPTDDQVHDLFADLNARWPFAVVTRLDRAPEGQHFFQIHLDYVNRDALSVADVEPEVEYDVEFRAGGSTAHRHTRVTTPGFGGLDRVMRLYRAWSADDPGLMELAEWELLRFEG